MLLMEPRTTVMASTKKHVAKTKRVPTSTDKRAVKQASPRKHRKYTGNSGNNVSRRDKRTRSVTEKKIEMFLEALREGHCVIDAAEIADSNRHSLYRIRREDSPRGRQLAIDWDQAYDDGTDHMEKEVERRAIKGIDEPIFYQGVKVATKKVYSDNLLMFMSKARRPKKFRDNVDMTNSDGSMVAAFAAAVRTVNGMAES